MSEKAKLERWVCLSCSWRLTGPVTAGRLSYQIADAHEALTKHKVRREP